MTHAKISRIDNVALLTLERGKVNALNELVVDDLTGAFEDLEQDESVSGVVLTGRGKARKMFLREVEDYADWGGHPTAHIRMVARKRG